jgi:EmrB/QacA subfamily drug resistance transporter
MVGRVRLYNLGFAVFTVASGLCGLAQGGWELVGFRAIQGLGAALLFSNSAAIITDAFPPNERGMALGTNQVAIVAGSVTGLVLGGLITSTLGWRYIFWVNVPVGIFATLWSHFKLRELARIREGQRMDPWGNVTLASGLTLILVAVTVNAIFDVGEFTYLLPTALGIALLVVFGLIETRIRDPMFDMGLFRIRTFTAGNIAIFLNALARGAFTLVMTLYLQGPTMGLDPLMAGLYLTPVSVSLSILGPISGRLSDRYGARYLASVGLLVSSVGFMMLVTLEPRASLMQLLPPLVLVGAGMGIFASPNRASIMNSVPPEKRGVASGMSSTLINTGGLMSLGLAFGIMSHDVPRDDLAMILSGTYNGDAPWVGEFVSSMHQVFLASAIMSLIAILPSMMREDRPMVHEVKR